MEVYLIPTRTPDRYELYYEAPDAEVVDTSEGSGFFHRMKVQFAEMLHEAEEWRHRRHEQDPEPVGILVRLRRRVMGFVVERIAEQRLLWHMRTATDICARMPSDLAEADANRVIRAMLKKDADHHLKWTLIDFALMVVSVPLIVLPGPNLPGLYFTFQCVSHFLSMRGAKQGLSGVRWTFAANADLAELREVMGLAAPQRQRRVRELALRLHLEHLATFCEDVVAPTA